GDRCSGSGPAAAGCGSPPRGRPSQAAPATVSAAPCATGTVRHWTFALLTVAGVGWGGSLPPPTVGCHRRVCRGPVLFPARRGPPRGCQSGAIGSAPAL